MAKLAEQRAIACCPPSLADASAARDWWRIAAAAVIAVNAMAIDLAINTTAAPAATRVTVHVIALGAALACVLLLGTPLAVGTWHELRRGRLTLEAMFSLGVLGAFGASLVALVTGEGAVYFEVVGLLLVVYSLGQRLTRSAHSRALAVACAWAPENTVCQRLEDGGAVCTRGLLEIHPGDEVVVAPGATMPVDGVVAHGAAFVREAEVTGESLVVRRAPGDEVWAGSHVVDGQLIVRVAAGAGQRRIDGVLDSLAAAGGEPGPAERLADRLVARFLPIVAGTGVVVFVVWTAARGWQDGLFNAMAVLLVACPCALGLATPLAIWRARADLAALAIVVRRADAIERLAAVDTVIFDKTGTLTETHPDLVDLVVAPPEGWSADDVRAVAAAVEEASGHPLAEAFAAPSKNLVGLTVTALRVLPGVGVEADVTRAASGRHIVVIGAPKEMAASLSALEIETLRRLLHGGKSGREVVIVIDRHVIGLAVVGERLRGGWSAASERLCRLGITTLVMTGDRAARVAGLVGIEVVVRATPAEKDVRVRALRAAGRRVLVVGDGVNDVAAMVAADAAIAVADGTELAREVADATWRGRDLGTLPAALGTCRAAVKTIRSNLAIAVVYNLVGIMMAAAGVLHPVAAALLMAASSLIVTWRAAGFASGDPGQEIQS